MHLMHDRLQPTDRIHRGIDSVLAGAYLYYIERLLPTTVEGREHLEPLRAHIKNGGSVIVFTNHTSLLDPGVITAVVEQVFEGLPHSKQLLTSTKFFPGFYGQLEQDEVLRKDPLVTDGIAIHRENELLIPGRIIAAVSRLRDIELVPMVQHYLMGEGKFLRHNVKQNLGSFAHVIQAIKDGPTVIGISMEGTRSKDGGLIPAQKGVNRLLRDPKVAQKTLLVPVALIGTDAVHHAGKGLGNVFAPVSVQLGEPVSYEQIRQDAEQFSLAPEDILMLRIAAMLPDEMLGYYRAEEFQTYLTHCREQMLSPTGVVFERARTSA